MLSLVPCFECMNFLFDPSELDMLWLELPGKTGCDHISTVWLPAHFVLFKYINNQKQLINFPSDASQQLLMSEKEKSLASLPPPPCPFPPLLLLPTPFPSRFLFRHKRFTLSDLLNPLLICLSERSSFLSYPSPRPSPLLLLPLPPSDTV